MLLKGQGQVPGIYATAVVGYLDEALSAFGDLNENSAGSGVNGVFHQLLDG